MGLNKSLISCFKKFAVNVSPSNEDKMNAGGRSCVGKVFSDINGMEIGGVKRFNE